MFKTLLPSRVGLVLAMAALLIPAAAAWASTVVSYTSVGQTMAPFQSASNATSASRDWNRVYRPVGNAFQLAYLNSNGTFQSAMHVNSSLNPFVDPTGSAFFARAWCENFNDYPVGTVTCQTTRP